MGKIVLFLLSILFIAGCGEAAEAEVVDEILENINEVNNYELEITTNVPENEAEDIYFMEIDMENSQGVIGIDTVESYDEDLIEMYYDRENVYGKAQEGKWFNIRMSVEEAQSMFFTDYEVIARVLEFMESKEETVFEEATDSYDFSYQTANEGEVTAFMDKWGFNSEDDPINEIAVHYQVNESTYFLEKVHLELMINDEDGQQNKIIHELHYKNINELPDIEIPEGIENEQLHS
ncbi:DUF6612 family protein [Oceanobacillus jeddahense]|uniref:Uncharacterized protein n=1 Tax=Oceanobacillus jeddahense TaxID=1462527 RepID=A0ABY5JMQ4_9BACI|nr:DUF6612 family protein [Oceanobacillus jeddahense]UUI01411.1 hypothetical protein NP439_15275 [Oceanobacillus jeddahense]